jgi:hypothetical protein
MKIRQLILLFFILAFQFGISQKSIDVIDSLSTKSKSIQRQKKIRFGFNLDWNLGYSHAKSGAPLEFLGRQPNPDVFGGSFDFLYKDDWMPNFSWKIRHNYYRIVHRYTPPNDNPDFNKSFFMYNKSLQLIAVHRSFESFGCSIGKHIFKKSKWSQYLNAGINLNLFTLEPNSFLQYNGITTAEDASTIGNAQFFSTVYDVRVFSEPNQKLMQNQFLPSVYNYNGRPPLWGLLFKNSLNAPQYYLISYKFGYTTYYPIAKGKLQLIAGCGFEYFTQPFLNARYTLYSKYDNINTSGEFKRTLSNAFIKVGIRFGKMGKEYFRE